MLIQGPVGKLEARLDLATAERSKTAILCHPHPQYGGSMLDGVLDTVADVLLASGINCLRFNFRGVGASEGTFDQGIGEVEDLRAVANWVKEEYPRDDLWLAGYSFGSSVVWRSLSHLEVEQAILVAPPVGMMSFEPQTLETQVLGVAGDQDEFVKADAYRALLGDSAHTIAGADHFFSGKHAELTETLESALQATR